jgi:endonuclease YncB( thermonuclease family)
LGEHATDRLQELLNGGAVILSSIDRGEDVYGRKLREVAVDGSDVGDTLISEGLARAYGGGRRIRCG